MGKSADTILRENFATPYGNIGRSKIYCNEKFYKRWNKDNAYRFLYSTIVLLPIATFNGVL